MNELEIQHHGIKGMRWGVRRYQNEDGTLTTAGKRRYVVTAAKTTAKILNDAGKPRGGPEKVKIPQGAVVDGYQKNKQPTGTIVNLKSQAQRQSEKQKRNDNRNRGTLSDAELKRKIERLKLEQELDRLTTSQVNKGRDYVTGILKDIGKKVTVTAGAGALLYAIKVAAGADFDAGEFANAVFNGGAKKK